jgi:hypothetical protein
VNTKTTAPNSPTVTVKVLAKFKPDGLNPDTVIVATPGVLPAVTIADNPFDAAATVAIAVFELPQVGAPVVELRSPGLPFWSTGAAVTVTV